MNLLTAGGADAQADHRGFIKGYVRGGGREGFATGTVKLTLGRKAEENSNELGVTR